MGDSIQTAIANAVSDDEAAAVCKLGQGPECCRFLSVTRENGYIGFVCLKHTEFAEYINTRVNEGNLTARGDNCPGKPP